MENFANLLRLTLERSGAIGLLLTIFSGISLVVSGRYLALPPLVAEWSGVGLMLGVAILSTSLMLKLGSYVRHMILTWQRTAANREDRATQAQDARDNLQTLSYDDLEFLYRILSPGTLRFDVHRVSPGPDLISKDILKVVTQVGPHQWTCELHPALAGQRTELMGALTRRLSRHSAAM